MKQQLYTALSAAQLDYLHDAQDAMGDVAEVGDHTRMGLDLMTGLLVVESIYYVAGDDSQTRYRDYVRQDGTTAASTETTETRGWGDSDARSNEH